MEVELYETAEIAAESVYEGRHLYAAAAATVTVSASEYVRRFGFDSGGAGAVLED